MIGVSVAWIIAAIASDGGTCDWLRRAVVPTC